MILSTKAKEAIKTALALALVYGIALKVGWMNPYWAAWAVGMIALGTAGQSIHKGVLRLAGTIPGCTSALVILALAPQSRWVFLLLVCVWIFFTTYMMIRSKNNAYFWNVAGFVCLIILLTGPGSSENLFKHAVFRTVETAMGIVVYTLVTVFLWPRTNAGAIKKTSGELVTTQAKLFQVGCDVMTGKSTQENLPALRTQEVQQLGQLGQALLAEGSESYEVHELRHLWERFQGQSTALMEALDQWQTGLAELAHIDMNAALPDLQSFFAELEGRFEAIQQVLGGSSSGYEPRAISLTFERTALHGLSHLDRAALAVAKKKLEEVEALTSKMLDCARNLAGESADTRTSKKTPFPGAKSRGFKLPVPDLDHLMGATFAAMTVAVGFLIWIFFNPPGHAGWFQFSGAIAMAVAGMQQMKTTVFIKPIAVASALGLAAYVFIMPQLSTFSELGLLLFLCMFVNCYFFSGIAQLAGTIAIINEISIQNQQTYDFAAMANSYVFTVLAFAFVFGMSYMLRSPRPEKAVLQLLGRFFRSAEFLISRMVSEPGRTPAFMLQWKTAFYRRELQTLPAKLGAWGTSINHKKFPNNTPEQVQALVTSLQALVYRMEELLDAGGARQAESLAREMNEDVRAWRAGIETLFGAWSENPEAESAAALKERLATRLGRLEARIDETLDQSDVKTLGEEDGENFYRLLGGFRGVSEAAVAYAGTAGTIDWEQWKEEMF